MFAAAASAAAIAVGYASASGFPDTDTYRYAREIVSQIFNVYALRMAAVFLVSQATLLLRTGVIHRWLAFLTSGGARPAVHRDPERRGPPGVPRVGALGSIYILVTHLAGHGLDDGPRNA